MSAFGGIIAFNRPVDAATVEAVSAQFLEVLIAPAYTADALAVIAKKANVRVLEIAAPPAPARGPAPWDWKRVGGGLLLQSADDRNVDAGRAAGRDEEGAHAGAARRPAVRLAGREVREVERDRLLRRRRARSASAPGR